MKKMAIEFNEQLEKQLEDFLYSFLPLENFSGDFERLRPFFEKFDHTFLENKVKIITIAGTNGKGETANCLKVLLEAGNKSVAVFTSPHILSLRERFSFFGEDMGYEDLLTCFKKAKQQISGEQVSFYEFMFYAFCQQCSDSINKLDYIILEVGLGGRKDTVNLLTPSLTAMTSISRDHQEILGNAYHQILFEKLGVIRANTPLITNFSLKYLVEKSLVYCKNNKTPYRDIDDQGHTKGIKSYSLRNQILAKCLDHYLNCQNFEFTDSIERSFSFPQLKGRFEMMTMGKNRFIFIGAHNIDGIRLLRPMLESAAPEIQSCYPIDEVWLSFSKRKLADILASIKIFKNLSKFYTSLMLTTFDHPKAWDIKKECESFNEIELPEYMEWKSRLAIMDRDFERFIAVTGSYYFIGEVQKEIQRLQSISY